MQSTNVWHALAGLVTQAALHDEGEALVVLQDAYVGQRVAVDQQEIGQVARLDLPEFMASPHDLAAGTRRGLQRFARTESEMLHEMLEVAGVGALRIDGEAVVAADHDANAALLHLAMR